MGTMAFADGTTTLTTTVPDATYTLKIPADQSVPFGTTQYFYDDISIEEANGFADGKDILVTISHTDFVCDGVSTTIPFKIMTEYTDYGSEVNVELSEVRFPGVSTGGVDYGHIKKKDSGYTTGYGNVWLSISSASWGKALGGTYTATVTYTSEIVAG